MNFVKALNRPEYIFRPTQIIRRVFREFAPRPSGYETVNLPWGLPIRIQPGEVVGSSIWRLGVHELSCCECICRLLDRGETGVDVGANIGQMTSLMAMRAGPGGKILAFEPHPILFGDLQYNIAAWKLNPGVASIDAHSVALSDHSGTALLAVPSYFDGNHGVSFLDDAAVSSQHYEVRVETLQAVCDASMRIDFLKIDVEGHELQVLKGAQELTDSANIRDILFEEHRIPPTPVTDLFEHSGYSVYQVSGDLGGPTLRSIKDSQVLPATPDYLATRDPARAIARMSKPGWTIYSRKW